MLNAAVSVAFAIVSLALLLGLWRLWRGPALPDRVMALDKLYVNAVALLVLAGIAFDSALYFEVALLIALIGFVSTVVVCKYLLRGDVIE